MSSSTPGAQARQTPLTRRELVTVVAVLAVVHLFLWWRSLPVPYQDLSFYFEPPILLARHGWLAGPGSHYHDLTYVRGMYFYPPGFSLILAGWITLFGASAASFLAYTNLVHLAYLSGLWLLLRDRLRCTRLATGLSVFAAFPMFGHGRADLTALLLGVTAWLTIPTRGGGYGRVALAGIPLGMAVLVSPPFGISSAAAVGVYFLASGSPLKERLRGFATLTIASVAVFALSWAAVLTWQGDWSFGVEQFAVNSRVRASELNHFPAVSPYLIAFSLIPFGFLTVLPAVAALLSKGADRAARRAVSLAYLAGIGIWFILSKAPLLTGGHFSVLGRPALHAAMSSARGWLGKLGLAATIAFAAIHWYHQKDLLLALSQGYDGVGDGVDGIQIGPQEIVGLDSDVFPHLYRDGRSVVYELMGDDYWQRSFAESSPELLAQMGVSGCEGPVVPDRVIVSERTLLIFGPPDSTLFVHTSGTLPVVQRATLLGREVRFPRDAGAVHVFVRRTGSAAADAAASPADCRLLPARPA